MKIRKCFTSIHGEIPDFYHTNLPLPKNLIIIMRKETDNKIESQQKITFCSETTGITHYNNKIFRYLHLSGKIF